MIHRVTILAYSSALKCTYASYEFGAMKMAHGKCMHVHTFDGVIHRPARVFPIHTTYRIYIYIYTHNTLSSLDGNVTNCLLDRFQNPITSTL